MLFFLETVVFYKKSGSSSEGTFSSPDSNSKFAKGLDLELPSDTASPAVVRTEPWRCLLEIIYHPGKVTWNGKNGGLEEDVPFQLDDFLGSMLNFRGVLFKRNPQKKTL